MTPEQMMLEAKREIDRLKAELEHAQKELRDEFAGQALANPGMCTGTASEADLKVWFGERAVNITSAQIVARQAYEIADAMLKQRNGE